MTVKNTQAPRRQNEETGPGKKDPYQLDCQFPGSWVKAVSEEADKERRGQDSDKDNQRSRKSQQRQYRIGNSRGLFLIAAGKKVGVDRNERRGQRSFTKDILEEVRNSKRCGEGAGGVSNTEIMREDPLPNHADNPADQNSGAHHERMFAGAFAAATVADLRARKAASAFADYSDRLAGNLRGVVG